MHKKIVINIAAQDIKHRDLKTFNDLLKTPSRVSENKKTYNRARQKREDRKLIMEV